MSVGVGLRHIGAAVAPDIRFQRVFCLALNRAELTGEAVDQRIAHELQLVVVDAVGVVTAQAERRKELLGAAVIRQGVQHHVLVAVRLLRGVRHDVRNPGIGVDNALNRIRRKRFLNRVVVQAGRYIRILVQHAVRMGACIVILVKLERRQPIRIDRRIRHRRRRRRDSAEAHHNGQHDRAKTCKELCFLHKPFAPLCENEKGRTKCGHRKENANRQEREAVAASTRQLEAAAVDRSDRDVGHFFAVDLRREAALKNDVLHQDVAVLRGNLSQPVKNRHRLVVDLQAGKGRNAVLAGRKDAVHKSGAVAPADGDPAALLAGGDKVPCRTGVRRILHGKRDAGHRVAVRIHLRNRDRANARCILAGHGDNVPVVVHGGLVDGLIAVVAFRRCLLLIVELAVQDVFNRDLSVLVGRRSRDLCAVLVPEAIHRALKRRYAVMVDLKELDAAPGDPVFDVHGHDRMLRKRHGLRLGLPVLVLDVDFRHGVTDRLLAGNVGIDRKILRSRSAISAGRDNQRPVVDVAGDLKVPTLDDPVLGRLPNFEIAEFKGVGDRNAVGRMCRLVLGDRHLLIRRELAAVAARHLMQHISARREILCDRIAARVCGNAVALGRVGIGIAACGFEVHLKNRALLELIVAVYHVGVFGDADLIELHLLVHRDGDLVVLNREIPGRSADRVSRGIQQVSIRGRDLLNVPVVAADVLLGRKLTAGVGRIAVNECGAAIHAVHRTGEGGVALRSAGRVVTLCDRGRPLLQDVRKVHRSGLICPDRHSLRLRLHIRSRGQLRHGQNRAVLQVRDGDGSVRAGLHRRVHAVARHPEPHARYHTVLRGLDDLQRAVHLDVYV